jgi:hypothetical protein
VTVANTPGSPGRVGDVVITAAQRGRPHRTADAAKTSSDRRAQQRRSRMELEKLTRSRIVLAPSEVACVSRMWVK